MKRFTTLPHVSLYHTVIIFVEKVAKKAKIGNFTYMYAQKYKKNRDLIVQNIDIKKKNGK